MFLHEVVFIQQVIGGLALDGPELLQSNQY